jgi:hypothetical protein
METVLRCNGQEFESKLLVCWHIVFVFVFLQFCCSLGFEDTYPYCENEMNPTLKRYVQNVWMSYNIKKEGRK